ncbi:hypothetical protein [Caproicibacter fermentans]|uniref:Uncharacterized protein n=1 Tax=Caproicibacter fermentans TaxID=2576756 RepID=A0A7G8TBT6_9FIRM|nr:hypothetical protein [Caproicibacter fermentans]QNK41077.1 hypothetical protein HCR03_01825 [Caproicibacter fermentans]
MDEKDKNEQNCPYSGQGQRPAPPSGYGRPFTGADWGNAYRDPYSGAPQNWQRRNPVTGPSPSNDEKAFSILAYIGILWLVGLLADRENKNVMFHVNQGIILSIFEFALTFSLSIIKAIIQSGFGLAFSGIGILSWTGTAVSGLLSFTAWCLVVSYIIIGVVRAAQGKNEPLPLIGSLFTVVH